MARGSARTGAEALLAQLAGTHLLFAVTMTMMTMTMTTMIFVFVFLSLSVPAQRHNHTLIVSADLLFCLAMVLAMKMTTMTTIWQ